MFYSPLLFHVSNQTNLDLTVLLHTEHTSFILSVTTIHLLSVWSDGLSRNKQSSLHLEPPSPDSSATLTVPFPLAHLLRAYVLRIAERILAAVTLKTLHFTESLNCRGGKGHLEISWTNPLLKQAP